jgi:hypothetical protein
MYESRVNGPLPAPATATAPANSRRYRPQPGRQLTVSLGGMRAGIDADCRYVRASLARRS